MAEKQKEQQQLDKLQADVGELKLELEAQVLLHFTLPVAVNLNESERRWDSRFIT